jgi:hypothetical protein
MAKGTQDFLSRSTSWGVRSPCFLLLVQEEEQQIKP